MVCVQKSGLNENIKDNLVLLENVRCFRQDKVQCKKKTDGDFATYVNGHDVANSAPSSLSSVAVLALWWVNFIPNFPLIIMDNVYIDPFCSMQDIGLSCYAFVPILV